MSAPEPPAEAPSTGQAHQPSSPSSSNLVDLDEQTRTRQAAWRLSARNKNNTAAWVMWAAAPFVAGVQIHDFYLGSIARGLIKIALAVIGWFAFMVGYMAWVFTFPSDSTQSLPVPGPLFWGGLVLLTLTFLTLTIWWIYDAFTMTRRLEANNDAIRHEVAAELRLDPWSF